MVKVCFPSFCSFFKLFLTAAKIPAFLNFLLSCIFHEWIKDVKILGKKALKKPRRNLWWQENHRGESSPCFIYEITPALKAMVAKSLKFK